jgi:hypothetical protein
MVERIMVVALDMDGPVVDLPPSHDVVRRSFKIWLPATKGAAEGIQYLTEQPDVDLLGIFTKRSRLITQRQTEKQLERFAIPVPVEKVVYTANSSVRKLKAFYLAVAGPEIEVFKGKIVCPENVGQIVLYDDSYRSIIEASKKLAREEPHFSLLQKVFTLVAFNSRQPEKLKRESIPGVVHIVTMQDWTENEIALTNVRKRIR